MNKNVFEENEHGEPITYVEVRYLNRRQAEWHVRNHLGVSEMDTGLKRQAYFNRMKQHYGDNMPKSVAVHVDLVSVDAGGTAADEFGVASDNARDWPNRGEDVPEDGFDEDGNEYWMVVTCGGDNTNSPGANTAADPSPQRFSINGLELLLKKGQMACIHGRFVRHILTRSGYALAMPQRETIATGIVEEVTPVDKETGLMKLDEMPRFNLKVEACAGPVKETWKDEHGLPQERYLMPSRKIVTNKGLVYDTMKFTQVLRKIREIERSKARLEEEALTARATEIIAQRQAREELARLASAAQQNYMQPASQPPQDAA